MARAVPSGFTSGDCYGSWIGLAKDVKCQWGTQNSVFCKRGVVHVLFVRGLGGRGGGGICFSTPKDDEGGHSTEEEEKVDHSLKSLDSGSSLNSAKHKFGVDVKGRGRGGWVMTVKAKLKCVFIVFR